MDMVVLAHIKEQSRLSPGRHGRPRLTEELKEVGVDARHRRVGRLMRENGTVVERTRKFKATTDSDHRFNIAPNLLDRDFMAERPNQNWAGDISYIWTREGGGVSGGDLGPALPPCHRLGREQPHEMRSGDPGLEDGHRPAIPAEGLHLPQRSRQPILFERLSEGPA